MPWNAAFPQPNDLVSQAPTPFQNNWAFLATNIGTDHYFNSGGATEGHHRYSQYVNQVTTPALSAGTSGQIFVKPNTTAGSQQPFFNNGNTSDAVNTRQIPTMYSPGTYTFGAPGNNIPVFDFTGQPSPVLGTFYTYNVGTTSRTYGCASFFWDGTRLAVNEIAVSGNLTVIDRSGTSITLSSSVAGNYQLIFLTLYP